MLRKLYKATMLLNYRKHKLITLSIVKAAKHWLHSWVLPFNLENVERVNRSNNHKQQPRFMHIYTHRTWLTNNISKADDLIFQWKENKISANKKINNNINSIWNNYSISIIHEIIASCGTIFMAFKLLSLRIRL